MYFKRSIQNKIEVLYERLKLEFQTHNGIFSQIFFFLKVNNLPIFSCQFTIFRCISMMLGGLHTVGKNSVGAVLEGKHSVKNS